MFSPRFSSKFGGSNLENLLHSLTPSVPSHSLPKRSCIHGLNSLWQPLGNDPVKYFTLGDLWRCFDEWSAYGVGSPVVLEDGETIMQYYAPYLSSLNIYTNRSFVAISNRNSREDTEVVELGSDFWSDESETDCLSRSLSNNSSNWEATSEESIEQDCSIPMKDKLGYVYLQYCEYASPFWRIPLIEKIAELARTYPGLMTLKSVELSPASWMAVAWYPIYHIPTQKHVKDLSTCFLTYHTLSSSFQDVGADDDEIEGKTSFVARDEKHKYNEDDSNKISLAPFALATHKMVGDLWTKPGTFDPERMIGLQSAADSWLKQLNSYHHDFTFFQSHSTV